MKAIDIIKKIDSEGLLQSVNCGSNVVELVDVETDLLRYFGDYNLLVEPRPGNYLAIHFNIKDNLLLGPADAVIYLDEGKETPEYLEGVAFYRIDQ